MKRLLMVIVALLAGGLGADVAVTDVIAKQRYPWNGLVDITCQVTGIEGTTNGLNLAVAAVMPETGVVRSLSQVWLVQGGTKTTEREVHTNGTYQLLWDARADLGTVRYTNMVVRVNLDAHEKVQLWEGGPYWATTNLGAEKPEDSGYYFWWGDTVGYKWENEAWVASDGSSSDFSFDSSNTPTYNKSQSTLLSEGWVVSQDGTYVLAPEHDAAQVHWGDAWRMPTAQELDILCYDTNVCDWTWSAQNGVNGYVVRGRGDYAANSIFLPAAGDSDHGTLLSDFNSIGFLWSSVPFSDDNCSWGLDFDGGGHATGYYGCVRYGGKSIRPVQGFAEASFVAGDSAPFLLDTLDSPRIAREVEEIAYSPLWGDAASCLVDIAGTKFTATNEGVHVWKRPETGGVYTFSYTSGEEEYRASFVVVPNVMDVVAKQRYPWKGLVDITCQVTGIAGTTNGLKLAVSAVMPETGNTRSLSHVWLVQGGTNTSECEVHTNGTYQLLWDARADLGTVRYTNMVVRVNFDAHEKVQLWEGGPYWATTNLGAEKPEDSGYYFWWGDTVGYKRENNAWVASDGSSSNFSFGSSNTPTYNKTPATLESEGWVVSQDGTYVLAPEHDAAQVQWGGGWRMPTYQELYDLCYNKCDWTWSSQNGVNGYIVRGRGDYASNSIFLPAAGYGYGASLYDAGSYGYYWSSVPPSDYYYCAYALYFYSGYYGTDYYGRGSGQSVRPVLGFTN